MNKTFRRLLSSGRSIEPEKMASSYFLPTYSKNGVRAKPGLVLSSGNGALVTDSNGNRYVDLGAGIAVNVLGHNDPDVTRAVQEQAAKLCHVSNLFHNEPALTAAEKLIGCSPGMGKLFFCNSGTEAIEAAIKFAHTYHNSVSKLPRPRFIAMENAFHGRSLGALSMTHKKSIRQPFSDLLIQNVEHVVYNSISAIEAAMGPDVSAVFLEPVQGEGGIRPASKEFISKVKELCDKYGSLLVFDEVQIGLGRQGNGRVWSYEEYGVTPDILAVAKPLANGLPMGATMLSQELISKVPNDFWLGMHGSTFASNPLVAAAANVVLDKLTSPGFLQDVARKGAYFINELKSIESRLPGKIVEIRSPIGEAALYAGVQLSGPFAGKVIEDCINNGVIVLGAGSGNSVLRLCPPLVISDHEIDKALKVLENSITKIVPSLEKDPETSHSRTILSIDFNEKCLESDSVEEYEEKLRLNGHLELPTGFKVGTSRLEFFPEELPREEAQKPKNMTLTLIVPEEPTPNYAVLYTSNVFHGSPVAVGRDIASEGKPIGAIVVNNQISNVFPCGSGYDDAKRVAQAVHDRIHPKFQNSFSVLPSSTGVIGWRLPVDQMIQAVPKAIENLSSVSSLPAAKGIMTTDSFPKVRSCVVYNSIDGTIVGRISGFAKGAGMIEPNMATMLCFVLTDIDFDKAVMKSSLSEAVNSDGGLNRISVDSDQSTSDTTVLISSRKKVISDCSLEKQQRILTEGLKKICSSLAEDIVRNGEGTSHVLRVSVTGAPSKSVAHGVGKAVSNSPLVKTAIAANDANVGRILCAVGSYIGSKCPEYADIARTQCEIRLGEELVFTGGSFELDPEKEKRLNEYLKNTELPSSSHFPKHYKFADIRIDLRGLGDSEKGYSSVVYGSDLTNAYVDINGGYRT